MDDARKLWLVVEYAQSGKPLPADVAKWLVCGIKTYVFEGASLDICLGLTTGPGQRSAANRIRELVRDDFLRDAASFIHFDDVSAWTLAKRLKRSIDIFTETHPDITKLSCPPTSFSPAKCALFHALKFGDAPKSARQLYRILL